MTFEEAMYKSELLKLDVLDALISQDPVRKKTALSAYIQFNPYMYQSSTQPIVKTNATCNLKQI